MNIQEQIGMLTFTPEVKRITFNSGQVKDLRDTMEKLLAVYEAAHVVVSEGVQHHWEAMNTLSTVVNDLVLDKQKQ